ncbi:MAG TPA: IclR family transcriptional regulator [Bryobacteraceae bacterium]|nr:IclR family transcriptional regulator [Bryobacteraceae bacterium]
MKTDQPIKQPAAAASVPRRRRPKAGKAESGTRNGAGEQYHLRAIRRALDVLECFTDAKPELNLKELGAIIGFPESSIFRILLTLESCGYLIQNADGAYRLAPRLLVGKQHESAERLKTAVRPILSGLASRFDETSSLAYLFGDHIHAIDTVETFHEIRMINKAGRVLPPHCSSLGKVITAFQERELIDRILECYGLYRRTEKTIVDRYALMEQFEQIRRDGYAVDREETVLGGVCIAAPIRFPNQRVLASLSVSTPLVRMSPEREQEIAQAVIDAAHQADALVAQPGFGD